MLIRLVADMHQPMHAGLADDFGGTTIILRGCNQLEERASLETSTSTNQRIVQNTVGYSVG